MQLFSSPGTIIDVVYFCRLGIGPSSCTHSHSFYIFERVNINWVKILRCGCLYNESVGEIIKKKHAKNNGLILLFFQMVGICSVIQGKELKFFWSNEMHMKGGKRSKIACGTIYCLKRKRQQTST